MVTPRDIQKLKALGYTVDKKAPSTSGLPHYKSHVVRFPFEEFAAHAESEANRWKQVLEGAVMASFHDDSFTPPPSGGNPKAAAPANRRPMTRGRGLSAGDRALRDAWWANACDTCPGAAGSHCLTAAGNPIRWTDTHVSRIRKAGPQAGTPMPTTVKCPGCPLKLPTGDLAAQKAHMEADHPGIIAARLAEVERLRGWARDD